MLVFVLAAVSSFVPFFSNLALGTVVRAQHQMGPRVGDAKPLPGNRRQEPVEDRVGINNAYYQN